MDYFKRGVHPQRLESHNHSRCRISDLVAVAFVFAFFATRSEAEAEDGRWVARGDAFGPLVLASQPVGTGRVRCGGLHNSEFRLSRLPAVGTPRWTRALIPLFTIKYDMIVPSTYLGKWLGR